MMRAKELGLPGVLGLSSPSARVWRMRAGYHSIGSAMALHACTDLRVIVEGGRRDGRTGEGRRDRKMSRGLR